METTKEKFKARLTECDTYKGITNLLFAILFPSYPVALITEKLFSNQGKGETADGSSTRAVSPTTSVIYSKAGLIWFIGLVSIISYGIDNDVMARGSWIAWLVFFLLCFIGHWFYMYYLYKECKKFHGIALGGIGNRFLDFFLCILWFLPITQMLAEFNIEIDFIGGVIEFYQGFLSYFIKFLETSKVSSGDNQGGDVEASAKSVKQEDDCESTALPCGVVVSETEEI